MGTRQGRCRWGQLTLVQLVRQCAGTRVERGQCTHTCMSVCLPGFLVQRVHPGSLDKMIALAELFSHSHCLECLGCEDAVSLWFSQDSSSQ